jgi:uncharacterized protein YjbI with pentapeptide repeats
MSAGLLYGRAATPLNQGIDASDALFAATLADGWTFEGRAYEHCTFANVSFKDATLANCTFLNCAFLDCYFRGTKFSGSSFTGCKFEDSTFVDASFIEVEFSFPVFRGCFIPFKEVGEQLPDDPGMRFKMADELAREAAASGAARDARRYRLASAKAYDSHQANIALAVGSDYYRQRFERKDRAGAAGQYISRRINRALWGYGERGGILARSFLVVGAAIFPALFWLFARDSLKLPEDRPLGWVNYELFSFDNLLNRAGFSHVVFVGTTAEIMVGVEVLVGLLFIGLFISLIFNWMRRR